MDPDIQRYVQTLPQCRESLDFLQSILDFQADLAAGIEPGPGLDLEAAREKWQAGQPLLSGESLAVSPLTFGEALADLRPLLPSGEVAQVALDRLLASSFVAPSNVKALLDDLMAESDVCLQRLADATDAGSETLAFLLYTVLSPFFEKQSAPYREWLEGATWRRGICPMCGSEPWMSRLAHDDGRRVLACSLCRTEWAFDRVRCPFCGGGDKPALRHFTVDDDDAHRVDCCDGCQRFIKTVDERVTGRPANLPVEDVITSHLDALAREYGYH